MRKEVITFTHNDFRKIDSPDDAGVNDYQLMVPNPLGTAEVIVMLYDKDHNAVRGDFYSMLVYDHSIVIRASAWWSCTFDGYMVVVG